ncbi:MAG: hypothetical protein Q7S87_16085 [Agitococcus sp.]|nr:hypothetical protein [Agitococcus sp.]MDO9179076.1 hypothetical protein [Agitococcus sp.]
MKITKNQANAVRTYLAGLGCQISHVQALEVIARGAGNRSRHVGPQVTAVGETDVDVVPLRATETVLHLQYGNKEEHSLFPRSDWVKTQGHPTYGSWLAMKTSDVGTIEVRDICAFAEEPSALNLACQIKAGYLAGACESEDVAIAVDRLRIECAGLFATGVHAWEFLMEESHDDSADTFGIQTESELFGEEFHFYCSEEERQKALYRLMNSAIRGEQGISAGLAIPRTVVPVREYYFFQFAACTDLESDNAASEEYAQALDNRTKVAAIDSCVWVDDAELGTIDQLVNNITLLHSAIF